MPIIADAVVDPAFGTGAVKITPGPRPRRPRDRQAPRARRPTILADDATVADTGTPYDGLDRYEARRRIVADLEARGDLVGSGPHEMVIGRCQRSDDVVEPRLKTQWFIRTAPLAARALEATRTGRTADPAGAVREDLGALADEHPRLERQPPAVVGPPDPGLVLPGRPRDGHRRPRTAPTPARSAAGRRPSCSQDPDIFDTWFSSGLWPFSTLGWPDDTADLRRFYPTSVMETGYDIIFFWVARMMMLGLQLTDREPFHTVYLSGLIRDPEGQKMSKTKGNVVDPLGVIDETGADALRFALIHGATPGQDQRFGTAKLENARNFANKLWNATRFVVGARPASIAEGAERRLPDARHLGPGRALAPVARRGDDRRRSTRRWPTTPSAR